VTIAKSTRMVSSLAIVSGALVAITATASNFSGESARTAVFAPAPTLFAPEVASTISSEVRLTISPDGRTALWFSRNRPGGPGGYDIWMSRRIATRWGSAAPVSFDSPMRDFDPAFSSDGRFVYFCSDRPGGLGGDDIYRVAVTRTGFGKPVNLGQAVNSEKNEFSPMLSPDRTKLLFSSDRPRGRGRHDLYVAHRADNGFAPAAPLAGDVNGPGDEFDATFLSDSQTIVFAHAGDFRVDQVNLYQASPTGGRYGAGVILPPSVNDQVKDSYGAMLDWSVPNRLTFSGQRDGASSMELYTIGFSLM
jgi:TolB protein